MGNQNSGTVVEKKLIDTRWESEFQGKRSLPEVNQIKLLDEEYHAKKKIEWMWLGKVQIRRRQGGIRHETQN